jgi:hypothetical protein
MVPMAKRRVKFQQRLRHDPVFALWFASFFGAIAGYLLNHLALFPYCPESGPLIVAELARAICLLMLFSIYLVIAFLILILIHDHLWPWLFP